MSNEAEEGTRKKKIPAGSIKLQMMGDLMFARVTDKELALLFKRYQLLLETFANMDKDERLLNYKFLVALSLTSHAKKTQNADLRKELFHLKNQLFLNIANDRKNRKKLAFRYLKAKNFRIIKFCETCEKENTAQDLPRHKWKFCKECEIDRNFFDVVQMTHFFDKDAKLSLYLSHDQIEKLEGLTIKHKGKLEKEKERGLFGKFQYTTKNLDVFDLDSVKDAQAKLLKA